MEDTLTQVGDILAVIVKNLTNPAAWQEVLARKEVWVSAFVALNLIVFTETGLLVGFFLPGDSLLVTAGIVAHLSDWNVPLLVGTLCLSAVVGDTVGYWIGAKAGPAMFSRPDSRFFKRGHLLAAQAFYDRHGGKAIVYARFAPFVRTFAPVVAGAARMKYRTFLAYNVAGGVAWVASMILFGYYLIPLLNPPMRRLTGNEEFTFAKHIDKVAVAVIAASVAPLAWKAFKGWQAGRSAKGAAAEAVTTVPAEKTAAPTA